MSLMNVYFDILSPFKIFNAVDFEALSKQLEKLMPLVAPLMHIQTKNWTGEKKSLIVRVNSLVTCVRILRTVSKSLSMYPYIKVSDKQLSRSLYDTSLRIFENTIAIFDDNASLFSQLVFPTSPRREEVRQKVRLVNECCKKISSQNGRNELGTDPNNFVDELSLEMLNDNHDFIVCHLKALKNLTGNISELLTFFSKVFRLAAGAWDPKDFTQISRQLKEVVQMLEASPVDTPQIMSSFFVSVDRPIKIAMNALWLLFTFPSIKTSELQLVLTFCRIISEVFINSILMLDGMIKCQLEENCTPELSALLKDLSANFESLCACCQGIFTEKLLEAYQIKSNSSNPLGSKECLQTLVESYKRTAIDGIDDDAMKEILKANESYLEFESDSSVKCSLCQVKLNQSVNSWVCHFKSLCHCSTVKQGNYLMNGLAAATFFIDSVAPRLSSMEISQKKRIDELMNTLKEEINVLSVEEDTTRLSFYCNVCMRSVATKKVVSHVELTEHRSKLEKIPQAPRPRTQVKSVITVPEPSARNTNTSTRPETVQAVNHKPPPKPPIKNGDRSVNHTVFQSPDYKHLDSRGQETVKNLVNKLKNKLEELSLQCQGNRDEPYFYCHVCKTSLRAVFVESHVDSGFHRGNLPAGLKLSAPTKLVVTKPVLSAKVTQPVRYNPAKSRKNRKK